ncbi:hypothetical protein LAZ67_12001880 [Cordylochernes scorpioides]|uniref:DUF5641 domain-containing protein n=1 Tax=Cordylochernes scorpioides TaxID=51811 RepID=A0ABY6L1V5_9ARAC|nr:hypothetical protein LAZ67_12001880 [Cordylochernes scorpioides]
MGATKDIINSRPLTYVSSDPTEKDSLTPNHFLRGAKDTGPSIPSLNEANNRDLRDQRKKAQQLTNEFWIKWTRDYIPKLMPRSKWHHQTEPIRTGVLVFLVDELHLRNMWKRGFVSDVHFEPDGQVRVATINTNTRESCDLQATSDKDLPPWIKNETWRKERQIHEDQLYKFGRNLNM